MMGQAEHITAVRVATTRPTKVVSRSDDGALCRKLTAYLDGIGICLIARGLRCR
jgi:hypothetical protein